MIYKIVGFFIFFSIIFIFISFCLFLFLQMINGFFFKKKIINVFYLSLIINFFWFFVFFVCRFFANDFLLKIGQFANYYLGFLLYGFLISFIFYVVYFILKTINKEDILFDKKFGFFILFFFFFINFLAIYNFEKDLQIEKIKINTQKTKEKYKFVLIGDIQYGTVSKKYMEKVFFTAIEQKPDFILFVGDLIDFENYKEEDFYFLKNISVPIYFVRGNHEFYHNEKRILDYLQKIDNVEILIDEKKFFKDLDIFGVDYKKNNEQLIEKINNLEINKNKFSIFLYHEPKNIDLGVEKGFDLMLYGHTHAGQLFPFNKVVDYLYKYSNGFYKEKETKIYVTSGAGLFGPKMRLGSRNEIVFFEIN